MVVIVGDFDPAATRAAVLDRLALGGLIGVGFAAYAWRQWTSAEPAVLAVGRGVARLRNDPLAALVWIGIASLVLVNLLGAVASQRANPYDDDICYTPFVRRLLDAGDLIEPFSFRRLSAFGGQTVLSALAGVRVGVGCAGGGARRDRPSAGRPGAAAGAAPHRAEPAGG